MGLLDRWRELNTPLPPETMQRIHPAFVPMRHAQQHFADAVTDYLPPSAGRGLRSVRGWANEPGPSEEVRRSMIGDKPYGEQGPELINDKVEEYAPEAVAKFHHKWLQPAEEMAIDWNPVSGPASLFEKGIRAGSEGRYGDAAKNLLFSRMAPDAWEIAKQLKEVPEHFHRLAELVDKHPVQKLLGDFAEHLDEGGGILNYMKGRALPHAAAALKAAPHGIIHFMHGLAHPFAEGYSLQDEAAYRMGGGEGGEGGGEGGGELTPEELEQYYRDRQSGGGGGY
jgi:hypothetical protein